MSISQYQWKFATVIMIALSHIKMLNNVVVIMQNCNKKKIKISVNMCQLSKKPEDQPKLIWRPHLAPGLHFGNACFNLDQAYSIIFFSGPDFLAGIGLSTSHLASFFFTEHINIMTLNTYQKLLNAITKGWTLGLLNTALQLISVFTAV